MKLTKATLKRLIKEELLKEAKAKSWHEMGFGDSKYSNIPGWGSTLTNSTDQQEQRTLSAEEIAEEARYLGGRIESELDDMDVDLSTLVANVDRMYQDFRALLVDYVKQETGKDGFDDDVYADTHRAHMGNKDLAESRRRTRRSRRK
jgi:hypothetical protein